MASKARKAVAAETLKIIENGFFINQQGVKVSIKNRLDTAVTGTQLIRPADFETLTITPGSFQTIIQVYNETTFGGAGALESMGVTDVCSLNFASAKNPGGGFRGGSKAQEESLARASGLYACLQQAPDYYRFHKRNGDCMYSHHMIYSPAVPVFRDDLDELIDQAWMTSIITSPAVNAGVVRRGNRDREEEIKTVMFERIDRVLRLASAKGHRNLVLGAWGCGVFRNDPRIIASLFKQALAQDDLQGVFERVRFSVLDWTAHLSTFRAFTEAFGPWLEPT